ncbi:MAG: YbaN family protein [Thaumarchaeota archaeon]|nr:YbaN family protein [Nitrososphaerota archaeon]MCL5316861.1 YbaN family protein [Nitrososphaerota archaeon]
MVAKEPSKIIRVGLIISGTFFLGLGLLGLVLPILPTTPFLLLAAFCYSRSSKRMNDWLMSNRLFGSYLKNYKEGRGMPVKAKLFTISFLWVTITFSAFTVVTILAVQIILILVAIGVTVHLLKIKNLKQ